MSYDRSNMCICQACEWHGHIHGMVLNVIPHQLVGKHLYGRDYTIEYCPECQFDKIAQDWTDYKREHSENMAVVTTAKGE